MKLKDNDGETITCLKKPEADLIPLEKLTNLESKIPFFEILHLSK